MDNISSKEKAELLKDTIYQLYSKEGRSKSYISRLLKLNRKTLSEKIKEWEFPKDNHTHHVNPSTQKYINENRQKIKSMLDKDISVCEIAKQLGVGRDFLGKCIIANDEVLNRARQDYVDRMHVNAALRKEKLMEESSLVYDFIDLDGEEWKSVLGYDGYYVSNKGRVKSYSERYKSYHLISQYPNKNNGRMYVTLYNNLGRQNLQVSRLVAFNFVDGYSDINNTVNHLDGDVTNNDASNLEWASQAENNAHACRCLGRTVNSGKRYKFSEIVYEKKYHFKTVAAFARFLGISETQTRRYMDSPRLHKIQFINDCND